MVTAVALACDWGGDWLNELSELLSAMMSSVEVILSVLGVLP